MLSCIDTTGESDQSQEDLDEEAADQGHVDEMTSNGIPRHDAVAALAQARNDLDKAYEFHFKSLDKCVGCGWAAAHAGRAAAAVVLV